ncbi:MAG: hypothetical protein IKX30_17825, partial [Victivallales bacterium]|nr:hypothetical protein [Victivallales bacterium]
KKRGRLLQNVNMRKQQPLSYFLVSLEEVSHLAPAGQIDRSFATASFSHQYLRGRLKEFWT